MDLYSGSPTDALAVEPSENIPPTRAGRSRQLRDPCRFAEKEGVDRYNRQAFIPQIVPVALNRRSFSAITMEALASLTTRGLWIGIPMIVNIMTINRNKPNGN